MSKNKSFCLFELGSVKWSWPKMKFEKKNVIGIRCAYLFLSLFFTKNVISHIKYWARRFHKKSFVIKSVHCVLVCINHYICIDLLYFQLGSFQSASA